MEGGNSNRQSQEESKGHDTSNSESFTGIRKNLFYERYQNINTHSRNNLVNLTGTGDQTSLYNRLLQNSGGQLVTTSAVNSFQDKTHTIGGDLEMQHL